MSATSLKLSRFPPRGTLGLLRTSLDSSEKNFETLSEGDWTLFQTVGPQSSVLVYLSSPAPSALDVKQHAGGTDGGVEGGHAQHWRQQQCPLTAIPVSPTQN